MNTVAELRTRMMSKKATNDIATKKIVPFLRSLLKSEKDVEEFVDRSLGVITPEVIKYWVQNNVKLIPDTTRKLYFENRAIKPLFRKVVKNHWTLIDYYLGHPDRTYERLIEAHPDNMKILESEETKRYIEKEMKNGYSLFYKLAHENVSSDTSS